MPFLRPRAQVGGDRRLAVSILGILAILAVVGDVVLLLNGFNPPGGLLALAGVCSGALATLTNAVPSSDLTPVVPPVVVMGDPPVIIQKPEETGEWTATPIPTPPDDPGKKL